MRKKPETTDLDTDINKQDGYSEEFNEFNDWSLPDEIPADKFNIPKPEDAVEFMMNPDPVLLKLEQQYGGYYLDRKDDMFRRVPKKDRIMNDKGVVIFSNLLSSAINTNVSQANINEVQCHIITYEYCDNAAMIIAQRGRELGLKGAMRRFVVDSSDNHIFSFASRGINNLERTRFNQQIPQNQQQQNPKWWTKVKNAF